MLLGAVFLLLSPFSLSMCCGFLCIVVVLLHFEAAAGVIWHCVSKTELKWNYKNEFSSGPVAQSGKAIPQSQHCSSGCNVCSGRNVSSSFLGVEQLDRPAQSPELNPTEPLG